MVRDQLFLKSLTWRQCDLEKTFYESTTVQFVFSNTNEMVHNCISQDRIGLYRIGQARIR